VGLFLKEGKIGTCLTFLQRMFCFYVSVFDTFGKFNTLDTCMEGNETNITTVSDKVKWKGEFCPCVLVLWGFVEKSSVETRDYGTD
jgi:hypothetical protein